MAPPGAEPSLPLELPPAQAELQRPRPYLRRDELIPLEQEAERLHGRLPQETIDRIKAAAIEAGLNGGQHSPDYGGQGWSMLDWAVVEEQYGRSTNGIYWHVPNAYNVFDHATPEQAERYLPPADSRRDQGRLRGDRGRGGLGPLRDRVRRRAHRRRLPDQRREVVRDLRRRRLRC